MKFLGTVRDEKSQRAAVPKGCLQNTEPLETFWEESVCRFTVHGDTASFTLCPEAQLTYCHCVKSFLQSTSAQCVPASGWVRRCVLEIYRREQSRDDIRPQRTPALLGRT